VPNEVLGATLFAANPTAMCPMNISLPGEPEPFIVHRGPNNAKHDPEEYATFAL